MMAIPVYVYTPPRDECAEAWETLCTWIGEQVELKDGEVLSDGDGALQGTPKFTLLVAFPGIGLARAFAHVINQVRGCEARIETSMRVTQADLGTPLFCYRQFGKTAARLALLAAIEQHDGLLVMEQEAPIEGSSEVMLMATFDKH